MEITIDLIKQLVTILNDNKLDTLKLGDLEISKSRHEYTKNIENTNKDVLKEDTIDPDELLYFSSSSKFNKPNESINNPYLSPKSR